MCIYSMYLIATSNVINSWPSYRLVPCNYAKFCIIHLANHIESVTTVPRQWLVYHNHIQLYCLYKPQLHCKINRVVNLQLRI